MELKLVRDHHIACYNTDQGCRLTLSALLDYAQDMAGDHAEILGFGADLLMNYRVVWILSRIKVRMEEYPVWRDEVVITTWHRGLNGPFYIRDYEIKTKDGRRLGSITSSWLLLNIDERKLIRSDIATEPEKICSEVALEPVAGKVRIPKDVEMVDCFDHVVRYSDVDKNGHTNNVKYTVMAQDCLDREFVTANPVKEYEINFVKEAMPGETIHLRKGVSQTEEGPLWFVEGYVDGQQSFVCKMQF